MKMQIPGKCKLEAKQKKSSPSKRTVFEGWPLTKTSKQGLQLRFPPTPGTKLTESLTLPAAKCRHSAWKAWGEGGAAPWSSWNWCQLSLSLYISSVCPWEKTEVCCGITKGKRNILLPSSSSMALQQHTALPRRLPHLQVSQTAPPTGDRVLRQ